MTEHVLRRWAARGPDGVLYLKRVTKCSDTGLTKLYSKAVVEVDTAPLTRYPKACSKGGASDHTPAPPSQE